MADVALSDGHNVGGGLAALGSAARENGAGVCRGGGGGGGEEREQSDENKAFAQRSVCKFGRAVLVSY